MPPHHTNIRGMIAMSVATGSFVVNDTFMKMVATDLPPLQTLFMRGVAALIWFLPLIVVIGQARRVPLIFNRWVLARNGLELVAVTFFVIALARLPIADVTAIGQIAPFVFFLGVALLHRQALRLSRLVLIMLGFTGALMVAQPTGEGLSVYAALGFLSAVAVAGRDLAGRKVPADIPAMIVALSAIVVVMTGAGLQTFAYETWQTPQAHHYGLLALSGFFLIFGHYFIFVAYRLGEPTTIAPFYYTFTLWAVLSSVLVFGDVPNGLAIGGMALILSSGLVIVWLDGRRRPAEAPAA